MRPRVLDCEPVPGEQPRVVFRDADLLVVDKPQGWLTHPDQASGRPAITAWIDQPVGVHHRLDVDTTGVLVLSLSKQGAAVLQEAFERRQATKRYLAVCDSPPPASSGEVDAPVPGAPTRPASTRYEVTRTSVHGVVITAWPTTGRRHQVRAHLASLGCPIRGDARFGDAIDRRAPRTLLHCAEIRLPDGRGWEAPPPPDMALALGLGSDAARAGLQADSDTTCYRERNQAADGAEGLEVDRYGPWLWIQARDAASPTAFPGCQGVYRIDARVDRSGGAQSPPDLVSGVAAPMPLEVHEHGTVYHVELGTRLSTGIFLDQRPQRAWLARQAGGMRVLNTFAHAGGFSIAAARAGAETLSLDLSRAWLERIPPQLEANGVSPAGHDQIYGDVFSWLPRLAKRGEKFDLVILDPPSTSVGKRKKRWQVDQDYPSLVSMAAPLVAPGGRLWTATNHRRTLPRSFARLASRGLPPGVVLERVCPPAVDFPVLGPAPVKTLVWRWPQ